MLQLITISEDLKRARERTVFYCTQKIASNDFQKSRDTKYQYYLHGPLGRTELGEKQVQGTDYVFTIQGWIKGVNSNVLDRDKDIGKDGHNINATNYIATQQGIHSNMAVDAYGYTLDYFWNNATGKKDYKPINTNAQSLYNDAPNATSGVNDLYNGNIKGMAVALQKPNGTALPLNLGLVYNQYKYDQLNRITLHQAYTGTSTTAYASLTNTNEYRNVFSYDANGNIITQLRNGTTAAGLSMDNLQYNYYTSTGSTYNPATATPTNATNKLAYVDDSGTPANYADDLEDQNAGNYTYDAIGQLTGDVKEEIANIEWTVYGKIKNINRTSGSTKKELTFKYDALGQRVMKLAKSRDASGVMTQENWTYTYYVRDAQGNVMATYKRSLTADIPTQQATDKLLLEESHLYGSSRLGIDDRETENISSTNTFAWGGGYTAEGELVPAAVPTQSKMTAINTQTPKRKLGQKLYELSNHLGNVLVTVSDRKLTKQLGTGNSVEYYMADVRSTSDYSAFGAPLSGRSFSSNAYRYSMNGQEKDEELGSGVTTAEYWEYDAKLGRRWNVDPKPNPSISSYACFANNPIWFSDVKGDTVDFGTKGTKEYRRNKFNHFVNYTFSKSYKHFYNRREASSNVYHMQRVEEEGIRTLQDGGTVIQRDNSDSEYDWKYTSGFSLKFSTSPPPPDINPCSDNSCIQSDNSSYERHDLQERRIFSVFKVAFPRSSKMTLRVTNNGSLTFDPLAYNDRIRIYSGGRKIYDSRWRRTQPNGDDDNNNQTIENPIIVQFQNLFDQNLIQCNQITIKVTTGSNINSAWKLTINEPGNCPQ